MDHAQGVVRRDPLVVLIDDQQRAIDARPGRLHIDVVRLPELFPIRPLDGFSSPAELGQLPSDGILDLLARFGTVVMQEDRGRDFVEMLGA